MADPAAKPEIKPEVQPENPPVQPPAPDDEEMHSEVGSFRFRIRLLNPKTPLFLPEGSIRAIITLMLLAAVIGYNFLRIIFAVFYKFDIKEAFDLPEQLWTMAAAAVFFYFGSRNKPPSKDDQ